MKCQLIPWVGMDSHGEGLDLLETRNPPLPGSEAISAWSFDMETSIFYKLYRRWHQCNARRIIMYYPAVLWGEQRKLKGWT